MQNLSWLMGESASTFGPTIDRMWFVILIITGIVFFATQATLVVFIVKYRHKEGRKAEYIHGNTKAEVIWTAVPFLIVISIALASRGVWAQIRDPESVPANAMDVRVRAKQFEWNVIYPGPDGLLDTGDDFTVRNRLDVPIDRPTRVILESDDVIHSFFVPDFRVKQDAVPGMQIGVWFQPTRTGEFTIGCAELCGIGHTRMRGTLTVRSAGDYQSWMDEQIQAQQEQ